MRVLTINCGSSSLKFDVLDAVPREPGDVRRIARGEVSHIGRDATGVLETEQGRLKHDAAIGDHSQAFEAAVGLLREGGLDVGIEAVGHRIVHSGSRFSQPALIDRVVLRQIEAAGELAPLHNAPALSAVQSAMNVMGAVPMAAIFDTAFYADLPEVASTYAIPEALRSKYGIRRFGFHGLAHRYMIERFQALHPDVSPVKVISLQLGSGCSATASIDGRPLDTSMGLTPLEGLIMGTRSGDLDPALPLFLARQEGMSVEAVEDLLNKQSGLLGLSGRSNDMRELLEAEAAGDSRAGLAVDAFCYRITKYVGAYLAALGGADALVFGGGIGERSPEVRRRVCKGLEWAGLHLNNAANDRAGSEATPISAPDSQLEAWVIPVDEASVIAADTASLLA